MDEKSLENMTVDELCVEAVKSLRESSAQIISVAESIIKLMDLVIANRSGLSKEEIDQLMREGEFLRRELEKSSLTMRRFP